MRILILYVMCLLYLACLGMGCRGPSKTSSPQGYSGSIDRVAVCYFGFGSGQITLDLGSGQVWNSRRLVVVKDGKATSAYRHTVNQSQASAEEIRRVADLVTSAEDELTTFEPNKSWFKGVPALDAGQEVLAIKWKTRSVCFALPPDEICSAVPEDARKVYKQMERISSALGDIAFEHRSTARVTEVTSGDPLADQLERDCEAHFDVSLPKGRRGW